MEIDVPKYDRNIGLQLCWHPGYSIKVSSDNSEVTISANREGLLSMANHLLNLAQADVPPAHIYIWMNTIHWKTVHKV